MLRWFAGSLIVIVLAGSVTVFVVYEQQRSHDKEMGKRFPFTAEENGQLLTEEDGRPLRFRTRADALRYEHDYEQPNSKEEGIQ